MNNKKIWITPQILDFDLEETEGGLNPNSFEDLTFAS